MLQSKMFSHADRLHLRPNGWMALSQSILGSLHNFHPSVTPCVCKSDYEEVLHTPYTDQVICFFTFNSPLSNMYSCSFMLGNDTYNCAEQFITMQKALLFGNVTLASKLHTMTSPHAMKRLAKHVGDSLLWHEHAHDLIMPGIFAKFEQNDCLRKFLLWTGEREIVEASRDRFWGAGHDLESMDLWVPSLRTGRNVMGRILMEVRALLLSGTY